MPDAMLVLGDTNSCLSAYIAKRMHIPVFQYGGGEQKLILMFRKKLTDGLLITLLTSILFILNMPEGILPSEGIYTTEEFISPALR